MPRKTPLPSWAVQDVRYVEVALSDLTTRHLHIEFDHGVRIVVAHQEQIPLAVALIESLRQRTLPVNQTAKGGLS